MFSSVHSKMTTFDSLTYTLYTIIHNNKQSKEINTKKIFLWY